jgi:hypothetical protein
MSLNKKKAAAVSAVLTYLNREAEQERQSPVPSPPGAGIVNVWGISSRQSQMQIRNMMQLKAFHGPRRF